MKQAIAGVALAGAIAIAPPPMVVAAPPAAAPWKLVSVNGTELEYSVSGRGDPVLLIHGSILADAFAPLVAEPRLRKYRLIRYHRRGFAGSARAKGAVSIADQAADARALLDRLGIAKAHVVGHSYGAVIGLQLALDAPSRVRSLALLEPPLFDLVPSGPAFSAGLEPAFKMYQAGDKAGAIDAFMRDVAGPEYRARLTPAIGAAGFDQAVADADTFFQVEVPALQQWRFAREDARRIQVPVLTVVGAESAPAFKDVHALLKELYPTASEAVIPNATHALQMMNARAVAEALATFFARRR